MIDPSESASGYPLALFVWCQTDRLGDIRHLRFLVSSFHRKSDGQYDFLCERGGTGSSNICLNENGTWRRAEKLAAFIMGYRQGNGDSLWGISGKIRTYISETHRYIEI